MDLSVFNRALKTGREEPTGQKWVTPIRWTSRRGHVITVDGTVWMFRDVARVPQQMRDSSQRIADAAHLADALADIGQTSKASNIPGMSFNRYRRVALVVHSWLDEVDVGAGDTPGLAVHKRRLYNPEGSVMLAKRRSVLLGVMLRPVSIKNVARQIYEYFNNSALRALGASEQILHQYAEDTEAMEAIFARHSMNVPTAEQFRWLDAWYNGGRNPDVEIVEYPDRLVVGSDVIEMIALQHFDTETMSSGQRWIGDILNSPDGPMCLAAFATLEPADQARGRTRKAARRTRRQAETGAEIGDEVRGEHESQYGAAKELEDYFLGRSEPWLSQASIVLGRRQPHTASTFTDEARSAHGINFLNLTDSQHLALTETVLGPRQANPYLQDLSISHLANTGVIGYESLGDPSGPDIGVDLEGQPVHIDPGRGGRKSRAPIMPIFSSTGSGKTFLLQNLGVQFALEGWFTPFVNFKAGSDLSPMVDLVPGGHYYNLTDFIGSGGKTGALDPFSFALPERAAAILADFLLTFHHSLFSGEGGDVRGAAELRDAVRTGLQIAALGGARCAWDAIKAIDWPKGEDDAILRIITNGLYHKPLFALAIGTEPQSEQRGLGDTLVLIQYGTYDIPMPSAEATPDQYSDTDWYGVAVSQLIMTYCTELIRTKLAGVLIADEASVWTASQIGRDTINQFGRLYREAGGLLIPATQRPSDLLNDAVDISESHSRTLAGRLESEREQIAAASFMGLNVEDQAMIEERARFFATAGPVEPEPATATTAAVAARAPWFIHEDLDQRVSQLEVAVPEEIRLRFTTRPDEKRARRAAAESAELAQAAMNAAAAAEDIDPALLAPRGSRP